MTAADLLAKYAPRPDDGLLAEVAESLAAAETPDERQAVLAAALTAAHVVAGDDRGRLSALEAAIDTLAAGPPSIDGYVSLAADDQGVHMTAAELAEVDPDGFGKVLAAVRDAPADERDAVLSAALDAREWDAVATELLGALHHLEVRGGVDSTREVRPGSTQPFPDDLDEFVAAQPEAAGATSGGEVPPLKAAIDAFMAGDNEGTFSGDQA